MRPRPPPPPPRATPVLAEKLDEAAVAVGLLVLLFEGPFVELLQAEGAHKVLRVELPGHGGDAAAGDGLLAARAERAAALVVVDLAVRLAVVLEEAAVHKGGEAVLRIGDRTSARARRQEAERWDLTRHTKHSGCQRLLSAEM